MFKASKIMYLIGMGFNILQLLFLIVMAILSTSNSKALYDILHSISSENGSKLYEQYTSFVYYLLSFLFYGILLVIVIFQFRWLKTEDKTVISNIIVIVSTVVVFILTIIFTGFLPMVSIGVFYLLGAIFCLVAFWKLEI